MSDLDESERKMIREALQQPPDEYLRDHQLELENLRPEVEGQRLVKAIDAVLEDIRN